MLRANVKVFLVFLITPYIKVVQYAVMLCMAVLLKNMRTHTQVIELAGIGMLHKSNMVPVRKDSNDAKEIARMRRG